MTLPTKQDIQKRKDKISVLRKKITPDGHLLEKELVRIIRKAIDAAWMTSAHKLVFLEDRVIPDMNPETRTKWLIECDHCHNMFKLGDVEVDHKVGEFACKSPEDFANYIEARLCVGFADLQILCKSCHETKTYAERWGVTFEEAAIEKEAIAIQKRKEDKDWLTDRGLIPAKNAELRRQQIVEVLSKEKQ